MINTKAILTILIVVASSYQQTTDTTTPAQQPPTKLNNAQVWGFGVLAGIGISSLGFIAAIVLVIAKKYCNIKCFETLIKFLFSLSCGALVGDAVVHIMAEAYSNEQTNKRIVSLVFIVSLFLFMIFDRILHAIGIAHAHWVGEKCVGDRENHGHHHHALSENNHNHEVEAQDPDKKLHKHDHHDHKHHDHHDHGHHHDHDHGHKHNHNHHNHEHDHEIHNPENIHHHNQIEIKPAMIASDVMIIEQVGKTKSNHNEGKMISSITNLNQNNGSELIQADKKKQQEQKAKNCCDSLKGKGSAGYINIVGSVIHNFFDGLAIGVAFATGNPTQIIPVVVAIIAHEIPRQLGDVAILLRSQFSEVQTVLCNGMVNFMSLIGVFIGLAVVNMNETVKAYIMVFVAGNFIYIASDIWQHIIKNKGEGAKFGNFLQFMGLTVGIGSMFLLTLFEN